MVAKVQRKRDTEPMIKTAAAVKSVTKKRGKGRPVVGENDVGRERLIKATEKLLRTMPPARVTISRIAQEANADPALIRYYFGNRTALLVAVVDRMIGHVQHAEKRQTTPSVALANHIGKTVQFVRSAPFMHRLMIDELAQAGDDQSRARVRDMNLDLVAFYRELLSADGGEELVGADPFYLHLAVLGASDFFSSAAPLIRELVPEGTDMEKLTTDFQQFLVTLFLNGLRKR